MSEFPAHPDDVTAQWLSELLGARVGGVSWEPIGTGQVGDSVRFHLKDVGEGGPATLAGKFPAEDPASRGIAVMMGLYAKEVSFYQEAAAKLRVRTPEVHCAKAAPDGSDFVLIFEDLGPARGGNQIDGCSLDDARAAIKQAAALHASSWDNAGVLGASWLIPPEGMRAQLGVMYPQAQSVFQERYAGTLEPKYMALCEELAATPELWTREDTPPQCLVHGDFRLDNMLFDIKGGTEPIAVLDWQTVTAGNAMTDIGYFLGCGVGDDLRRVHEEALLHDYLTEMDRRGVTLTRDDIWHDYRIGALHGVSTAVFSAANVERTERGDANFLSMARGACALALEHDSIGALREVI